MGVRGMEGQADESAVLRAEPGLATVLQHPRPAPSLGLTCAARRERPSMVFLGVAWLLAAPSSRSRLCCCVFGRRKGWPPCFGVCAAFVHACVPGLPALRPPGERLSSVWEVAWPSFVRAGSAVVCGDAAGSRRDAQPHAAAGLETALPVAVSRSSWPTTRRTLLHTPTP